MTNTNNINFTDVIKQVAQKTQLQQKVCKKVIEGYNDVIINNITNGKRVVIRSFGAFYRRERKPGIGRDVRNNSAIPVKYSAKNQLAFKAIRQFMDI